MCYENPYRYNFITLNILKRHTKLQESG